MSELYRTRGSEALNYGVEAERLREHDLRKTPLKRKKKKIELQYERYIDPKFIPAISPLSFLLLVAAVASLVIVSGLYLQMNNKVTSIQREIKKIQAETEELKRLNDNIENKLYVGMDLEEIRERALNELGMVYPYKNHVVKYQAVSGGYVRQFSEMKGEKSLNLFEKALSVFMGR